MRAWIPCTSSKSNTTADCTASLPLYRRRPSALSLSPSSQESKLDADCTLPHKPTKTADGRDEVPSSLANPSFSLALSFWLYLERAARGRTSRFGEGNHFSAVFIPRRIARATSGRWRLWDGRRTWNRSAFDAGLPRPRCHTLERGSKICTLSHHSLCIRSAVQVYSYVWMSQKSESLAVARCLHWLAGWLALLVQWV